MVEHRPDARWIACIRVDRRQPGRLVDGGTGDIDVCRDVVSVACETPDNVGEPMDVPGVLRGVDPSFFLIPELDLTTPSASIFSRSGLKVDFLTTAKTPRDTRPRVMASYMDFSLRLLNTRALSSAYTSRQQRRTPPSCA